MAKHLARKHGGVYLPGIRDELRAACEREVLDGDPRCHVAFTEDWTTADRRRVSAASPAVRQARRLLERLDGGEDIECGRPVARTWPELADAPWWRDVTVRRVVVAADDTVRPIHE